MSDNLSDDTTQVRVKSMPDRIWLILALTELLVMFILIGLHGPFTGALMLPVAAVTTAAYLREGV